MSKCRKAAAKEQKLETKIHETKIPDTKPSDIKMPETKILDAKILDAKILETKLSETKDFKEVKEVKDKEIKEAKDKIESKSKISIYSMHGEKIEFYILSGNEIVNESESNKWKKWKDNRKVDSTNVERQILAQEKKYYEMKRFDFYFNPIVLCQAIFEDNRPVYLIDGQHRVDVMKKMKKKYSDYKCDDLKCKDFAAAFEKIQCPVTLIKCDTIQEIEYNFERVNSGTPLPPAYYDKKISAILDAYIKLLDKQYPNLKKPAANPHRPNYNDTTVKDFMSQIKDFRDAVIDGKIDENHLMRATQYLNDEYKRSFSLKGNKAKTTLPESILEKIKESKFYLGSEKMSEWSYKVVSQALKNIGYGIEDDELESK